MNPYLKKLLDGAPGLQKEGWEYGEAWHPAGNLMWLLKDGVPVSRVYVPRADYPAFDEAFQDWLGYINWEDE